MTEPDPGPGILSAGRLINQPVVSARGEDLGRIEEVMIDTELGQIAYGVISFGGRFGMGEKLFALPWMLLEPELEHQRFVIDIDLETLKQAPGFDKNHWPRMGDRQWGTEIHQYYGLSPYWEEWERGGPPPERPEEKQTH